MTVPLTPLNIDRRSERRQDELLDEAMQLLRRAEVVEQFAGSGGARDAKEVLALSLRVRASTKVAEAISIQVERDDDVPVDGS